MRFFIIIITTLLFKLAYSDSDINSYEVDNQTKHEKYKVDLSSGKKDDYRFYRGVYSKTFSSNIDHVYNSIINFEDKCNNDYKDRRKLLSKSKDCRYHNSNVVESKIYTNLKKYQADENEIDRFLVARRIYNRQSFSHIDLIKVYRKKGENAKDTILIKMKMLSDKKVEKYMKPVVEQDSVFSDAYSEYELTEVAPNQTILKYFYVSKTDHWLLNKSVSVSKVFDNMAKSIDLLFHSIQKEIALQEVKVIKNSSVAVQKIKK